MKNFRPKDSNVGSPFKKSCASEPINLPSHLYRDADKSDAADATLDADEASQKKKRRLQSKSLDEVIISPPTTFKTPTRTRTSKSPSTSTFRTPKTSRSPASVKSPASHLKSPSAPLSPLVLPSFWTTVPVDLSPPTTTTRAFPDADDKLMPPPAPVRQTFHHNSHLSCPVDSDSPKRPNTNASNFSFDSG